MKYLLTRLLAWSMMAALAYWLATRFTPPMVFIYWAGAVAAVCALGALLMSRQPVGVATISGQFGASLLRWGYQISRGQLPGVVAASWLVWTMVGIGVMAATASAEQSTQLMIMAWLLDFFALLYCIGLIVLARQAPRPLPRALFAPMTALVVMLAGSSMLWQAGTEASRRAALLLGAGPIPVLAIAYALFVATMLVAGRKGGWR